MLFRGTEIKMIIREKLVRANLLTGQIDDPEYNSGFRTGEDDK